MKNSAPLVLLIILSTLLSFSIPEKNERYISIIESSEEMLVPGFSLDQEKTLLKSGEDYDLLVEIRARCVNGKVEEGFRKVKKKGIRYKVKYIYKYLPSKKKMFENQDFIIWDDGVIENWQSPEITIEGIKFKTKIIS